MLTDQEDDEMLKQYPTYFNTTEILRPFSWSETPDIIETINETESAKDLISVARYDKMTIDAKYRVTSSWLKIFKEYSQQPSISVKIYDPIMEGYKTRTMRMRNLKTDLIRKSEIVDDTNGLWEVSFKLIEF